MGKTLIGKIIYFWIFIIGGLFIARIIGLTDTTSNTIVFIVALACFYWGFAFIKSNADKKRGGKNGK